MSTQGLGSLERVLWAAAPARTHGWAAPDWRRRDQVPQVAACGLVAPAGFDWWSRERLQRLVAPGQYTAITESIYDGVLQKFVMPREAYDHVIRRVRAATRAHQDAAALRPSDAAAAGAAGGADELSCCPGGL